MKKPLKSPGAKMGKKPQVRIRVSPGWWDRLVNFCQENGLGKTARKIYEKTTVSRRTFLNAKKSNDFTEAIFDILAEHLGRNNRGELLAILGGEPEIPAKGDQITAVNQQDPEHTAYYDSKHWLQLLKEQPPAAMNGIILQALSPTRGVDCARILSAITDPICIKEYADRLVGSSRDVVDNFYSDRFGELPDEIRKAVSLYISADINLHARFRDAILEDSYFRMFNWFQLAAKHFPECFALEFAGYCVMPQHLETLRNYLREEKFILLDCLAGLILHFRKFGCQNAERKFLEVCLENDYAVIRTALKREQGMAELTNFLKQLNGVLSKKDKTSLKGLL